MDNDTKKILEEILSTLKKLDERVTRIEGDAAISPAGSVTEGAPAKRTSIKEFLIQAAPTNGVQTTLAIAYFIEKYDGVSPVNTVDLERGFRAAKEPVPGNINDKTNMCVKNGHLMEAESKKDSMKAWVVTRSGEKYVQDGFNVKK